MGFFGIDYGLTESLGRFNPRTGSYMMIGGNGADSIKVATCMRDEEIEHQLFHSGETVKIPLREPCDHFIGWEEEEFHGVYIIMKSNYDSFVQSKQYDMDFKFTYCPKCGVKL